MRAKLLLLLITLCSAAPVLTAADSPARQRAIEAWYEGDHRLSAELLEELLLEEPENQDIRLDLIVVLREIGELDRAAEHAGHLDAEIEKTLSRILAGRSSEVEPPQVDVERREATLLLLEGIAMMRSGRLEEASELLSAAARQEEHLPHAQLYLGELELRIGEPQAAIAYLEEALRQDRNLTAALPSLARATYATGATGEAYRLLRRAELALPWRDELAGLRESWERRHPELLEGEHSRSAQRRRVTVPPRVAELPPASRPRTTLRVGLSERLESVYIKSGGPFEILQVPRGLGSLARDERRERLNGGALTLYTGEAGIVLRIRVAGEEVVVESEEGEELLSSDRPVRVRQLEGENTTTIFDLTYGEGSFFARRVDRSYRGDLEFIPFAGAGLTLVNELSVEEYLYSVIPSEMPASWPMEALKAQAVAARSYTLHDRRRFRERGFDLLSSVTSAHYSGVTGEHPRSTQAVASTRGLVLADGGGTLDAVYSANSGGYTESSESVWGFPTSLVAVADPLLPRLDELRPPSTVHRWLAARPPSYSGMAPYASPAAYRWRHVASREELELRLRGRGVELGTLERILPGRRGRSGRVESVTVVGSAGELVVRRDAIRSALGGLRSNLFVMAPVLDSAGNLEAVAFHGAGWGHGVGLCQTGAAGMAAAGYDAEEILNHYYPENPLLTHAP